MSVLIGVNEAQRWSTYSAERAVLFDLLRKAPGNYAVEIGCFRGATTAKLACHCASSGKRLIAIDPWCGDISHHAEDDFCMFREAIERHAETVITIRARSDEVLEKLPEDAIGGCGFVFVDGDHRYEQVLRDMAISQTLCCPGGVVVVHDVFSGNHPGVRRAFDEFTVRLSTYLFRHVPSDEERLTRDNDRTCGLGWFYVS